jgi:hypothetical protein
LAVDRQVSVVGSVALRGVEGIMMVSTVKLNNGYHFPVIGLGTYNVSIPNNS